MKVAAGDPLFHDFIIISTMSWQTAIHDASERERERGEKRERRGREKGEAVRDSSSFDTHHVVHVGVLDLTVQVVDIGSMVTSVVNVQGLLAHDRLQRVLGVRQVREGDGLAGRGRVHRPLEGRRDLQWVFKVGGHRG